MIKVCSDVRDIKVYVTGADGMNSHFMVNRERISVDLICIYLLLSLLNNERLFQQTRQYTGPGRSDSFREP
ncbi:hypothetical protein MNBD_GAMMA09-823 [hydrothermal vent metagenome]|uniref:Uncharacterized protein n=1 Tax=hydrothermal vent metagenome TaxID=652676 RepID=A0A3B0XGP6_9ZZZZ